MRFQRVALPLEAEEWVWEVELNADAGATLVLSAAPPSGYHLYLKRLADGLRIELSANQSIPISGGHHRVRIRLTKQTLGWDVLDAIPRVTQLLPNYPNPFNPETWIPFNRPCLRCKSPTRQQNGSAFRRSNLNTDELSGHIQRVNQSRTNRLHLLPAIPVPASHHLLAPNKAVLSGEPA
jgi:hypothetical protein